MTTMHRPHRGRPRKNANGAYVGLSDGARRVALLLARIGIDARSEPVEVTIAALGQRRNRHFAEVANNVI